MNWKEAKLFAKRVGNDNQFGLYSKNKWRNLFHFPSTGPFVPTREIKCLKEKNIVWEWLLILMNWPPHFGEFEMT